MINYSDQWKHDIGLHQIPYDEFVSIFFTSGIFIQKVDGMLGTLVYSKGQKPFFQTTSAKEIIDIPVLEEYEKFFNSMNITEAKIPGELVAKKGGVILPFNETQSIVKRFKESKNKDLIYHYPVDIISLNKLSMEFNQSLLFILKNFRHQNHISLPKVVKGGLEDFRKLYKETMIPGFDGVVARGINGRNYKVKYINSVDLVIMGAGHFEMPSWPRRQVSYLLTSFIDKNGLFRSSSKVGTGFTLPDRSKFYDFIMKNRIYDLNGEVFVKPKLMIEVKFFRSRITNTPAYIYTGKQYLEKGSEKSVTFSHPSFVRERPDKEVSKLNARLEQIADFEY